LDDNKEVNTYTRLKDFSFVVFCLIFFAAIMNDGMHDRIPDFLVGCLAVCYIVVNEERKSKYHKKDEGGI